MKRATLVLKTVRNSGSKSQALSIYIYIYMYVCMYVYLYIHILHNLIQYKQGEHAPKPFDPQSIWQTRLRLNLLHIRLHVTEPLLPRKGVLSTSDGTGKFFGR